jgi:hypothetical protein
MQYLRDVQLSTANDKSLLGQPMTLLTADAKPSGEINGQGNVLIVDDTTDNSLMTFRYRHHDVAMFAAEDEFSIEGRPFRAGAFVIPDADRAKLEPSIRDLGLVAVASNSKPSVKMHELDLPRIGYVHSWQRTQDEGWVRAALDTFGVPYTYFADQKLRDGKLREKYDVIIFPHVGGTPQSQIDGIPKTGPDPIPYKKTELTPNLGANDESDDIRGGMGLEGLGQLAEFVRQGGTLITEGSTAALMVEYGMATGLTVEHPEQLAARGTILRGIVSDAKSPLTYGYDKELPIYFNQDPVLHTEADFGGFGRNTGNYGQNVTPNASPVHISPFPNDPSATRSAQRQPQTDETDAFRQMRRALGDVEPVRPRVVMQFPEKVDEMLLSGMLSGGQALSTRVLAADFPLGKGHIVMFALRPFWRWQTQGTYFLGFNAILNWNDLDAGKPPAHRGERATDTQEGQQR